MIKRFILVLILLGAACTSLPWREPRRADTPTVPLTVPFGYTATPSLPTVEPTSAFTPTLSEEARRGEEYAIYSSILENSYMGSQTQCIVIEDHTTVKFLSTEDEQSMNYYRENLPGATEDLFEDFFLRNKESIPLEPGFTVDIPVILISADKISFFFSGEGDGWGRFYKAYPGAQGIMGLSRAGFAADMDQALVYVGNQSNYLAGAGYLLLMEKQDGSWKIDQSLMVWIS
jgi:hypothetical protein